MARFVWRLLFAVPVAFAGLAGAPAAQTRVLVGDCFTAPEHVPETVIAECTAFIDGERNDKESRAIATMLRALAKYRLGDVQNSLEDHRIAIETAPELSDVYAGRAQTYTNNRQYQLALPDINKAIQINPNVPRFYGLRALLQLTQNKRTDAVADIDKALNLAGLEEIDSVTLYVKGKIHELDREYDEAIDYYDASLTKRPLFIEPLISRGNTYVKLRELGKAVIDFDAAIKIDPGNPEPYFYRGFAVGGLGRRQEAIENFTRSIELNPVNATAFLYRGIAYQLTGDFDSAITDLKQAKSLRPDYGDASYRLGLVYKEVGEYGFALAEFERAFSLDPTIAGLKQALDETRALATD